MSKIRILAILTILTFAIANVAKSYFNPERLYVKNFNIQNGLSQAVVTDLTVDEKGFIWASTYDGLSRFDGSNITVFKHIPNDKHSLPSSKIFKILHDDNNHIWIKTTNKLSIFENRTGKILIPDFLKNENPEWLCKNDKESIWLFVRGKGLILVNTTNFGSQTFETTAELFPPLCEVIDLYKIGNAVFITGSCGRIVRFDIQSKKYTKYDFGQPLNNASFNGSGIDKYGDIYLGSPETDMVCFNTRQLSFQASPFNTQNIFLNRVKSIQYDSINDILIFGTNGQGLFIYDYSKQVLSQFKKNGEDLSLSSNYIEKTISDKNGIIYIGYDGSGMDVLDPFIKKFTPIKKIDEDDLKSLKFVSKIIEDDNNNLLLGTRGSGLVRYNQNERTFFFYNTLNTPSLSDNTIIEMIRVNNELWIGYNGAGIDILDMYTLKRIHHFESDNTVNSLTSGTIWSFENDHKGNIWAGTRENGLNKINIQTHEVKTFDRSNYPILSSGIRCITLEKNGNLLAGSEDGLFEIDGASNHIHKVFPTDSVTEPFNSFKSILIDKKGRIWCAMDGVGIVVLDANFRLLNNFNSTNALNNNVVYGILQENDSTFWISSNAGLTSFKWNEKSLQKNGKITAFNYDEKNGLQSNEFNTGSFATLKDGSMAFGGLYGINVFRPGEIVYNKIVPVVYIQEFKVFENVLKQDTFISYTSALNLQHFENSFSITFNTIALSLPGKTKFQYRLVGNDNEWINADGRNYVSYTNLNPGEYEFQVRACNYDGVWNQQYTSLKIIIATPFYKRWWFMLLVIGMILQLAYLFYRARLKLNREKEELKIKHTKQIAEVEMKALRAQINPHFLFNSLNSINSYILKNDNKMASKYLIKFSQLVRNILNNSSSPYITLQEELGTIELYMHIEGMRFNNQFSYLIDIESGLNTGNILIPSLLLQPYVENAIWHGLLHKEGEKNISIRVSQQSIASICITIEDNGVGRKLAAELDERTKHRKSFGMELGENRLKLMNKGNGSVSSVQVIDKVDENQKPSGTIIKIIIPAKILIEEKISLN